jgi:hypothetical protein
MPGYLLIEQSQLSTSKENGLNRCNVVLGLLDFLRELAQDDFPFPRLSEICVVGLEETLFAAQPHDREIALEIHRRLQRAASNMEKRQMTVQVVFQGDLTRGDKLWAEYRGSRLPIDVIFDSPLPNKDAHENRYYRVHFNLTSPAA